MKFCLSFLLFLIVVTHTNSRNLNNGGAPTRVPGTKFSFLLPDDFLFDPGTSGYKSRIDSSTILISETLNSGRFENIVVQVISNIISGGLDTSNVVRTTFAGYKSVQVNARDSVKNEDIFILLFGSDSLFVSVILSTNPVRKEELKKTILEGNYDKNLTIDYAKLRGFKANYEGTRQHIFIEDASTIASKEIDSTNKTVSRLGLTKFAKGIFEGLNEEETIENVATYYYPKFEAVDHGNDMIDGEHFIWKLYDVDYTSSKEFDLVGIIRKSEYDLIILAGAVQRDSIIELRNIINTIKFLKD